MLIWIWISLGREVDDDADPGGTILPNLRSAPAANRDISKKHQAQMG